MGDTGLNPPRRRKRRSSDQTAAAAGVVEYPKLPEDVADLKAAVQPSRGRSRGRPAKKTRLEKSPELPDLVCGDEDMADNAEDPIPSDGTTVVVDESSAKHVRFSSPTKHTGCPSSPLKPSPSSSLTPHMRRYSLSPAYAAASKKQKEENRRSSLPAKLFSPGGQSTAGQVQFTPLRSVLDERSKRRLRRSHLSEEINSIDEHKRDDARKDKELRQALDEIRRRESQLKELTLELELQRQMSIDVGSSDDHRAKTKELEARVATLTHEKEEMLNSRVPELTTDDGMDSDVDMNDSAVEADDMQVYIPDDDMSLAEMAQNTPGTSTFANLLRRSTDNGDMVEQGTQVAFPDPNHEKEIKNFEDTVFALTREAADARAALRVLSVELDNLGFAKPGENTTAILPAIRAAFHNAREELEHLLPGGSPDELTNVQVMNTMLGHIRSIAEVEGDRDDLHTKISDMSDRNKYLETLWITIDKENDSRKREILELQDRLTSIDAAVKDRDNAIAEKDSLLASFGEDNENQTASIEKLKLALESYRKEVDSLQGLIFRMESDHNAQYAAQEEARNELLSTMQAQLDREVIAREEAQNDVIAKSVHIQDLEQEVEKAFQNIDELKAQLTSAQEQLSRTLQQRDIADEEIAERMAEISSMQKELEEAKEWISELRTELSEVTTLSRAERRQREAAESEVHLRGKKIDSLNERLQEERTKITELIERMDKRAEENNEIVKKMSEDAAAEKERLLAEILVESNQKHAAEELAAQRSTIMAELEKDLRSSQDELQNTVAQGARDITSKKEEISKLASELESSKSMHAKLTRDSKTTISNLDSRIKELSDVVKARDAAIKMITKDAEAAEGNFYRADKERQHEIAALRSDLDKANTQAAKLGREKASLERRVEDEAKTMLEIEERHHKEMSKLTNTIYELQERINGLESELEQTQSARRIEVGELEERVCSMEQMLTVREGEIADRDQLIHDLDQERRSLLDRMKVVMQELRDSQRHAQLKTEEKAAKFLAAEEKHLDSPVGKRSTQAFRHASLRSNRDSGVGMSEQEMEMA
ncbi:hypothetical protein BDY21DRAFT_359524 [Lineolata rhizophorae]|uniref:Uncharacterized protein n=1 Tax=Lineolata rhizophorae TaxID=578093 RepID=A0A6A6NM93_9PEZI|nr:hypothetical protein BDY21DRAFT_359524 [Lineolata rhizophorae]